MNQLRCTFPDCECFSQCDDYRTRPVICPEEATRATVHRDVSLGSHRWHPGTAEYPLGPVHGAGGPLDCDIGAGADVHLRDEIDTINRRLIGVLAGLAIGSAIVLLYAVLT